MGWRGRRKGGTGRGWGKANTTPRLWDISEKSVHLLFETSRDCLKLIGTARDSSGLLGTTRHCSGEFGAVQGATPTVTTNNAPISASKNDTRHSARVATSDRGVRDGIRNDPE